MGPERLQHRLRGLADPLRPAHRPRRPAALVRRRRGGVHRRLCGVRPRPSVELLVAARVVQAFGAAMLVPASLALVIAAFPAERRAHAIGVWGASAAVAAGVGPPIGGALVQLGGWRWAFLVNLPFGLVAVWAARHQLVESRAPGRRVMPDLVGAALLVVSLGLLNLGIIKGGDWGWTSPAGGRLASSAPPSPWCCSWSARGATGRRCSTRRCCACARSTSVLPQRLPRASASTPTC